MPRNGLFDFTGTLEACIRKSQAIVKSSSYTFDPWESYGGCSNVSTLDPNSQSVVLLAKACGFVFGRFMNNSNHEVKYKLGEEVLTGNHSEDFFMAAWEAARDMRVMKSCACCDCGNR
jgi:hypothetical protein